jgi:hypothetical protein
MGELFRKLESPVLTDIAIDWRAAAWPGQCPTCTLASLVATASLPALDGEIVVRGRAGPGRRLPFPRPAVTTAPRAVGARQIEALADAQVGGANRTTSARRSSCRAAHHLVSRRRARCRRRDDDAGGVARCAPRLQPAARAGVQAIFGGLPQTAASARHIAIAFAALLAGLLLIGAAASPTCVCADHRNHGHGSRSCAWRPSGKDLAAGPRWMLTFAEAQVPRPAPSSAASVG